MVKESELLFTHANGIHYVVKHWSGSYFEVFRTATPPRRVATVAFKGGSSKTGKDDLEQAIAFCNLAADRDL